MKFHTMFCLLSSFCVICDGNAKIPFKLYIVLAAAAAATTIGLLSSSLARKEAYVYITLSHKSSKRRSPVFTENEIHESRLRWNAQIPKIRTIVTVGLYTPLSVQCSHLYTAP